MRAKRFAFDIIFASKKKRKKEKIKKKENFAACKPAKEQLKMIEK
jgi:hypothetical protein